jgi:hypothetical protein
MVASGYQNPKSRLATEVAIDAGCRSGSGKKTTFGESPPELCGEELAHVASPPASRPHPTSTDPTRSALTEHPTAPRRPTLLASPRTSAALRSLPLLDLLHRSFPLSTCRLCRSWLGTCCHRPNPHPSNRTTARRRSWNGHPTVLRERSESGHEERRRVECLKRAEASGLQKS